MIPLDGCRSAEGFLYHAPMRVLFLSLLLVGCFVSASCRAKLEPELPITVRTDVATRRADEWTPPSNWDTVTDAEFSALVERELPANFLTPLSESALEELGRALDRMDLTSVRAAVLLGRSRTRTAGNVLFSRLQKRESGPERHSDAGDVVAANALARFPRPERWWRLVRLVDGERPHPDIEVRVEAACTMLHVGIDRVIPFLLQILRIGTWEGQSDELDFDPTDTTAWIRGRAAEALSIRAGVPLLYHPDAPIAAREREARMLAELLAKAGQTASPVDPRGWPKTH